MNQNKPFILQLWIIFILVTTINCNLLTAQDTKPEASRFTVVDQGNNPVAGAKIYGSDGDFIGETNETGITYQAITSKFITIKSERYDDKTIRIRAHGEPVIVEMQLRNVGYNKDLLIPTGYAKTDKNSISSSVFHVGNEIVDQNLTASYAYGLVGQVPGLTVTPGKGDGDPGDDDASIYIRGLNTLNYNYPLILVDNIDRNLFDKGGAATALSNLQIASEEIESITVLKDAAAKAIYGMRGANGVILITTKRGKKEPVKIRVTSDYGVLNPLDMPDYLNAYDHAQLYNKALANDGKAPFYSASDLEKYKNNSSPYSHPNVNLYDEILSNHTTQRSHSLTFSGGNDFVRYSIIGSYLRQDGLFKAGQNENYERYNIRSNFNMNLSRTTELIMDVAFRDEFSSGPTTGTKEIMSILATTRPDAYPLRYENGLLGGSSQFTNNPDGLLNNGINKYVRKVYQGSVGVNQDLNSILNGLSASVYFSLDGYNQTAYGKKGSFAVFEQKPGTAGVEVTDFLKFGLDDPVKDQNEITSYRNFGRIISGYGKLNWDKAVGESRINTSLIMNQWLFSTTGGDTEFARVDYGIQSNYVLKDRYMAGVTVSYSGSEQFKKGNRFKLFPALSVGWVLSEEDFLANNPTVNYLKIRTSYGLTGNDKMGSNRYLYSYFWGGATGYSFNQQNQNGYWERWQPNPDITSEKSIEFNIGADAEFFKRQLFITADYFENKRTNILGPGSSTVPDIMGFEQLPFLNYGEVSNKGVDGQIIWSKSIKDFKYSLGLNFMYAKSLVVKASELERDANESYLLKKGKPVDQYWGLVSQGFFKTDQEISSSALQTFGTVKPGNLKYQDMNGDNLINENDIFPIGKGFFPDLTYGINLGAGYRNFTVKALLQGASEYSIFRESRENWIRGEQKYSAFAQNGWTPDNTNATYPRLTVSEYANDQRRSTFWLEDATYLRLKTAEIRYTLPFELIKKYQLLHCSVYARGYNLLTLSNVKGIDPEIPNSGIDLYPNMRIINLGINIEF